MEDAIHCVAFSPDGIHVALAGRESIRLWNTEENTVSLSLDGLVSGLSAIAFSPDGSRLAVGGRGSVRIWDITRGRELLALPSHSGWITGVAFSPDGRTLVAGGDDGIARMWVAFPSDLNPDRLPEERSALYRRWKSGQGY